MASHYVVRQVDRADPAVIAALRAAGVATAHEAAGRTGLLGPAIRARQDGAAIAGSAITVSCHPGDNLMVHAALNRAERGDVLVVDAGGDLTNAIMGELMLAYARQIGMAGVVINGAVRDYGWIRKNDFPVFAAGVTHRGPFKSGPGELNVTIALDGMVIEPGDLIVGDDDGVVCVPYADTETVFEAANAKQQGEEKSMAAIQAGKADRSWVEAALKAGNCEGA